MTSRQKQLQKTLLAFYQKPEAKVSIEAFFTVLAIIFFAVFAIRPTMVIISDLIKEIEDKEKLENQLQQKVAALSTAQVEYQANINNLKALDQAIPSRPKLLYSLKIIEKLAGEESLIVQNISTAEIPPEKDAKLVVGNLQRKDLSVKVNLTGDYLSIKRFVERLNEVRRTFLLHSITFSVKKDRGEERLSSFLVITIPFFGE